MMMTCRLLCALLVLALCCGPYVCAAGTNLDQDSGSNGNIAGLPSHAPATNSAPEAPGISNKNATPGDPADAGPSPSRREAVSQATTPSGLPRNGLGAEPGKVGGMGSESKVTIDVLRQKTATTGLEQKLTRIHLQTKKIRAPEMLPRRPRRPLQQRHQPPPLRPRPLRPRLQKRQLRRPPAHLHVFVKSTAVSGALRGFVLRCCSPHLRWRTPLWA
ncbi:putative mucin TcMUCII, partial [Trypanosoma cruzi]